MLTEPLSWLGMVAIGRDADREVVAFRLSPLGAHLPDEVYGPNDEKLWNNIGRESVANFRMLGNDGGNPLVLDIESHEVVILDHEGQFRPFDFVNSSIAQFMESLLIFEQALIQAPDVNVAKLQEELGQIDPRVTAEQAYWHTYAADLPDFDLPDFD